MEFSNNIYVYVYKYTSICYHYPFPEVFGIWGCNFFLLLCQTYRKLEGGSEGHPLYPWLNPSVLYILVGLLCYLALFVLFAIFAMNLFVHVSTTFLPLFLIQCVSIGQFSHVLNTVIKIRNFKSVSIYLLVHIPHSNFNNCCSNPLSSISCFQHRALQEFNCPHINLSHLILQLLKEKRRLSIPFIALVVLDHQVSLCRGFSESAVYVQLEWLLSVLSPFILTYHSRDTEYALL